MKRIETFEDIISEHRLNKDTLNAIRERMNIAEKPKERVFTNLQKEAFNTFGFWREDGSEAERHMIIHGATSSGKTLVSEIAILDCLKSRKKSIVLVPLKAMVRERWERFKDDLNAQGVKQVYASSSDFQDHDGDIVNGDYEVAVIVYEKFFAMLFQLNSNIMLDCALVVVDELQMLSSIHRGPKLEIAIQKIIQDNYAAGRNTVSTRIMCLTTCDCKVENIQKWLTIPGDDKGKEPLLITSLDRPTSLQEYVIKTDGTYRMNYICGEQRDTQGEEKNSKKDNEKDDKKIEVPGYREDSRSEIAKRTLLVALLKKIYKDRPEAKVLIFANGRNRTYRLATFLAEQRILEYKKLSGELEKINQYEGDDFQVQLREQLFPFQVAFHNSALSTALREYIEDLYKKEHLSLIFATETLTIGMNMPVDVMILFDATVHRGNGIKERLTSQEYKNFVGRAGRLGYNKKDGESYIIAVSDTDYNRYWEEYVNCRTEEIDSALSYAGEEIIAPYFLSLLNEDETYDIDQLKEEWERSFAYRCNHKSINMKKLADKLVNVQLCNVELERYEMTNFGIMMAPYAFSLDTCDKIRIFFLNGGLKKIPDKDGKMVLQEHPDEGRGGLPKDISEKDVREDRYLLDMLYILCCTEEVQRLSQLKLPSAQRNPDKSRAALDRIEAELTKMIVANEGEHASCEVWPQSPLLYMLENGYRRETEQKEAVMRAILLWYWTKGMEIKKIAEKTRFDKITSIVAGDMARLAEIVSYQLEAIHHCYGGYTGYIKFQTHALEPLYALSTRVHYGMSRDLVIIANLHIRGLDRKTILRIGDLAVKSGKYDSPVNFLKEAPEEELEEITDDMRNMIIKSINEIYLRDNLEKLLETMKLYQPGKWQITQEEHDAILSLSKLGQDTDENELQPLEKIFLTNQQAGSGEDRKRFYDSSLRVDVLPKSLACLTIGDTNFIIGVYFGNSKQAAVFNNFINATDGHIILLVRNEGALDDISYNEETGVWRFYDKDDNILIEKINLAMTGKVFSGLIAHDIALDDNKAVVLAEMLKDTTGAFRAAGVNSLQGLLQNYELKTKRYENSTMKQPMLRILCDERLGQNNSACYHLLEEMNRMKIPFRVLRWGEEMNNEKPADAPTLLYLSWEAVKSSRSLYRFIQSLRQNHYRNTFAVFESEQAFRNWGTDNPELPCNELDHCYKLDDYKGIAEKASHMLEHYKSPRYLIGISYAHAKHVGGDRPAVVQFRKIVGKLNEAFAESEILFDKNPSCENKFDGNGAIPETLELYRQCKYFIVLDDGDYDNSKFCEKEKGEIVEIRKNLLPHHLWLLHPDNDKHSSLYDEEKDYTTRMDFTEENTEEIARNIIQYIKEQK